MNTNDKQARAMNRFIFAFIRVNSWLNDDVDLIVSLA